MSTSTAPPSPRRRHRWGRLVALAVLGVLALGPVPAAAGEPVATGAGGAVEAALAGARSVALGEHHSCAVLRNGQVRCWGDNSDGRLGTGSDTPRFATAQVTRNAAGTGPLTGVVQVALGDTHSCALLAGGQVRCWGYNHAGQIGNGSTDDAGLPVAVRNAGGTGPLSGVRRISAGGDTTCALLAGRQVRCWGDNYHGELGNGGVDASSLPVAVRNVAGTAALAGVAALEVGRDSTCAALVNGQARCWGRNDLGGLGNGTTDPSRVPVVVRNGAGTGPLTGVTRISAGSHHACARLGGGQVRCWGYGFHGALGHGDDTDRPLPVATRTVAGGPLTGAQSVVAGLDHSCARAADGRVRCWGSDEFGQLGDGAFAAPARRYRAGLVRNPGDTATLRDVADLATGRNHSCGVRGDGRVLCWGYGEYGELGNGRLDNRARPVVVRM